MNTEELASTLIEYFGLNRQCGTYWHILTRVKESRHVGTMTIDDFEELSEETIYELAEFVIKAMGENQCKN